MQLPDPVTDKLMIVAVQGLALCQAFAEMRSSQWTGPPIVTLDNAKVHADDLGAPNLSASCASVMVGQA